MRQVSLEFDPAKASGAIASAIGLWVNRECVSLTERNNQLDGLEIGRNSIVLPPQTTGNLNDYKHANHHNRQRFWGQALIEEPGNDYLTARHIFNALMQVSGNSRMMRWLIAKNQAEYDQLKVADNIVGIEVEPVVASLIKTKQMAGDSASMVVTSAEESHQQSMDAFVDKEATIHYIYERAPNDFGTSHSPSLARLATTQELWVGVVADSILMAAGYRGGELEAVPFLEPKSISDDPQVYYPFQDLDLT